VRVDRKEVGSCKAGYAVNQTVIEIDASDAVADDESDALPDNGRQNFCVRRPRVRVGAARTCPDDLERTFRWLAAPDDCFPANPPRPAPQTGRDWRALLSSMHRNTAPGRTELCIRSRDQDAFSAIFTG
jgi:hypothetical protein